MKNTSNTDQAQKPTDFARLPMVVTSWFLGLLFSAESGATMVRWGCRSSILWLLLKRDLPPRCTLVFLYPFDWWQAAAADVIALYLFSLPFHSSMSGEYRETTVVSCSLPPKDGWANGSSSTRQVSWFCYTFHDGHHYNRHSTVCVEECVYLIVPLVVVVFIHHEKKKKKVQWKLSRKGNEEGRPLQSRKKMSERY